MTTPQTRHARKIAEQIRQYEDAGNMHDALPNIFSYWSKTFIQPRLQGVTGCQNHIELYAKTLIDSLQRCGNPMIASIGSGDGGLEIAIALQMRAMGYSDFRFLMLDLSPLQNDRALFAARAAGVGQSFETLEVDLNIWTPDRRFGAVMAHHALHHILSLEHLFTVIHAAMDDRAAFVTFDVIGRNGHMRWPEAYHIVNLLWKTLPPSRQRHLILNHSGSDFLNHNCAAEGFEGIRAQDILPLLVQYFHFDTFVAWGNLADPFVDRGYGGHFNADDPQDRAFITLLEEMNELLIDLGHLKPTQMFAILTKQPVEKPRLYKGRRPEAMIRRVD